MGTIVVNGKKYTGNSVSVVNNKIIIDGKVQHEEDSLELSIVVEGSIEKLEFDAGEATISGTVGSVSTQAGDVRCWDVRGSVSTMSGDVICKDISGSVSTMSGDIIQN